MPPRRARLTRRPSSDATWLRFCVSIAPPGNSPRSAADRGEFPGGAMDTQKRSQVASLEGRRVNLALRGGIRIDDCQLVSAGRGRLKSVWVFTYGQDASKIG